MSNKTIIYIWIKIPLKTVKVLWVQVKKIFVWKQCFFICSTSIVSDWYQMIRKKNWKIDYSHIDMQTIRNWLNPNINWITVISIALVTEETHTLCRSLRISYLYILGIIIQWIFTNAYFHRKEFHESNCVPDSVAPNDIKSDTFTTKILVLLMTD